MIGRHLLAATVALALGPAMAGTALAGWKPLLSPDELVAILQSVPEVRVVVSGDFAAGHIPGAA